MTLTTADLIAWLDDVIATYGDGGDGTDQAPKARAIRARLLENETEINRLRSLVRRERGKSAYDQRRRGWAGWAGWPR
jgi:hypothetical protein